MTLGKPKQPAKAKDIQKQKVYRWGYEIQRIAKEREQIKPMSDTDIDLFVKKVCRDYGQEVPQIRFKSSGGTAKGGKFFISLPPFARQKVTILHELSHTFCMRSNVDNMHGALFVRTKIELLNRYLNIPRQELLTLARNHQIEIGHIKDCPHLQIKIE